MERCSSVPDRHCVSKYYIYTSNGTNTQYKIENKNLQVKTQTCTCIQYICGYGNSHASLGVKHPALKHVLHAYYKTRARSVF